MRLPTPTSRATGTSSPTEGLPDDEYAEYEADVYEEPLTDEAAYGLEPDPTGEGQITESPAPTVTDGPYLERSRTVPADLVGGIWAETITRDDGTEYRHVSPDMLIIRRGPGRTVTRVDIVDVTVCLHHRFGAAHKAKEEAYEPLRRAIIAHKGLADDKVTVRALALGVWGHVPESALATLRALGLKGDLARRLLRNLTIVCTKYSANCCQTRRKLEAATMGPRGICTHLPQGRGRPARPGGTTTGTQGGR